MVKNCQKLEVTFFYRNMNSNRNGWDSTKRAKMLYFHCGPSTKILKKDRKKIERYIQNIKNIYKLKWSSP